MFNEVFTKDGDLLTADMKCAECGRMYHWERPRLADFPHEPQPITCPVCGSTEWFDEGYDQEPN